MRACLAVNGRRMSILDQADIDALLASANELVEEAGDGADQQAQRASAPRAPVQVDLRELRRILHMRFPVIVTLAERNMPLEDVLRLTAGSIIEFDRASDAELHLSIGNRQIGAGQAVKVGEYFGLRITEVDPVHDRIRAMGK